MNDGKPRPCYQGMTLMPGESCGLSIPISLPEGMALRGRFVEVHPPENAPVQSEAEKLGLVPGLRAEASHGSQWRCAECSTMQPGGSTQVWVPDSVRRGDPEWSVTEACRQNAWNGHHSAWCLKCAPKAKRKKEGRSDRKAAVTVREVRTGSFWSKVRRIFA